MQNILGGSAGFDTHRVSSGRHTQGVPFAARFVSGGAGKAGQKYPLFDWIIDKIAPCPWSATTGSSAPIYHPQEQAYRPLYTPEEKKRRDETPWTLVQGILAPFQFLVFAISLGLVLRYLVTGNGYAVAAYSVVAKTCVLYLIMITGCIWEKKVFDKYLFAPAFFWEDVFSMLVMALHTAYLVELFGHTTPARQMMFLAIAAYAAYVINATQFVLKLRAARLQAARAAVSGLPGRTT
jgi:3-vinyl bacteriochlorophyllide hydratase